MIYSSKETIDNLLSFFENKLQTINDNNIINGYIIFLLHLILYFLFSYVFFIYPISKTFYFFFFLWLLVIFSNVYFKGCLITKLERRLWNNDTWGGPLFFFINHSYWSTNTLHNVQNCFFIAISLFLLVRIVFKY